MVTDELVAFLRARLDEDEQVARAASRGPWRLDGMAIYTDTAKAPGSTMVVKWTWPQEAAHITRYDPARVLAEVEAKRAVIALWQTADTMFRDSGGGTGAFDDKIRFWSDRAKALDDALRPLALPYAGHPDYQDEWKP